MLFASNGTDVDVVWSDTNEAESRSGSSLFVMDQGAARPDGWSSDGRRITQLPSTGKATRRGGSTGRTVTRREVHSESRALAEDLLREVEKATRKIQRGNLSRRQQEALVRKIARDVLEQSTRRRAESARRIAAAYPHRPGLLAQIATWLTRMAVETVRAIVDFILGFKDGVTSGAFTDGRLGVADGGQRRREVVAAAQEAAKASRANSRLVKLRDGGRIAA